MKKIFSYSFIIFLFFQSSCGLKKAATHVIAGISSDGMVALESEEDISFARESSLPLIKTLEVLRHGNPKDAKALTLLSQAYGQFAFGFLEGDMLRYRSDIEKFAAAKQRADLFYRRGREYGIAALINSSSMKEAFKSPLDEFKKSVSKLSKKNVPALFWTAFNWACYLNLHLDDPNIIADLPRIQAMIDHVIKLDPKFYYGSAYAFKGVIDSSRPKMLGGNTDAALKEFNIAMDISPNYLMSKILFAQFYTKQIQDENLFAATLNQVLQADINLLPEQKLANSLAKERAKTLLTMKKEFFIN